jgi:hypothetical protein
VARVHNHCTRENNCTFWKEDNKFSDIQSSGSRAIACQAVLFSFESESLVCARPGLAVARLHRFQTWHGGAQIAAESLDVAGMFGCAPLSIHVGAFLPSHSLTAGPAPNMKELTPS